MTHRVLLVEDRPQDVKLTDRAIRRAGYSVTLDVAENGQIALDKLQKSGGPLPDLILLDWMMPLVNGEEVLREIKQNPRLKRIPVIVLTTSRNETDVDTAYDLGCNTYLAKPVDPEEFQETVEALGLYWLETALLPR